MDAMVVAAAVALMASPVLAQTRNFEFQGETTTATVDLTGRAGCVAKSNTVVECLSRNVVVAGVPNVWLITQYDEGRLFRVIGVGFFSIAYSTLLDAFTAEYGTPVLTTPRWRSQTGTTLQNDEATWGFADGTLILTRMGSTPDKGTFVFQALEAGPSHQAPPVNF